MSNSNPPNQPDWGPPDQYNQPGQANSSWDQSESDYWEQGAGHGQPWNQPPAGQTQYEYGYAQSDFGFEQPPPMPAWHVGHGVTAGFSSRLVAFLVDTLVASLLLSIPAVLMVGGIVAAPKETRLTTNQFGEIVESQIPTGTGWLVIGSLAILFLVAVIAVVHFYLVKPVSVSGQTFGRRLAKIRVVDQNTMAPIGLGRAWGRYLFGNYISGNLCFLGYLWMLFDSRQQTWHDMIVSSLVIRAE